MCNYVEIYSTKSEKSSLLKKLREKNFELVSKDYFSEKWYKPKYRRNCNLGKKIIRG